MKRLKYIGERPTRGSAIPLPEGWTMETHDEDDEAVAKAKLESGLYELAVPQGSEHLKERIRRRKALTPDPSPAAAGRGEDEPEEAETAETPE